MQNPLQLEALYCGCGCGQELKRAKYPSLQRKFINTHQHKGANNGNYKGGKSKYSCAVCLKEFLDWPSQKSVTCGDDDCYRTWQGLTTSARGQNKQSVNCATCKAEIRLYPSQIDKFNYCNRDCMLRGMQHIVGGSKTANWKGGKSKWWQEQAKIRDGYKCVICGFNLVVDVHHITPISEGGLNEFSNLITLCPNHHRLADLRIISVEHLRNYDWHIEGVKPTFATSNRSHTRRRV